MKNQYVGDIGDYGKFGLLRFLANHDIMIGVNWYLTENDRRTDGEIRKYLNDGKENGEKCYDADLFEKLKPLKVPEEYRTRWYRRSMDALSDADLVFADPDNGFLVSCKNLYRPNGIKYASIAELKEYYDRGQDVVCYCHKGRRKDDDWNAQLEAFNYNVGHNAKTFVLTFHRGTQRSFVFAIHPEREKLYNDLLVAFIHTKWGTHKVTGKRIPFTLDKTPANSD